MTRYKTKWERELEAAHTPKDVMAVRSLRRQLRQIERLIQEEKAIGKWLRDWKASEKYVKLEDDLLAIDLRWEERLEWALTELELRGKLPDPVIHERTKEEFDQIAKDFPDHPEWFPQKKTRRKK